MANGRRRPASRDLAAISRDLKKLIDQAQRIRDEINRHLNQPAPEMLRPPPQGPPLVRRVRGKV